MVALDTVKILIERVDQILYIAKRTGRNRVVSENELAPAISIDENGKFGFQANFTADEPYAISTDDGSDSIISIKYG